jgi:hypothetical protein
VGTPSGGSAVTAYRVVVLEDGSTLRGSFEIPAGTTSIGPLWYSAGHTYVARVTPINDADTDNWNSTTSNTVTAIGAPIAGGGLSARQTGTSGETELSWAPVGANGANNVSYFVRGSTSSLASGTCPADYASATSLGSATSWSDTTPKNPGSYYFAVYATNGFSCVAQTTSLTISQRVPGTASYTSAECFDTTTQLPCVANPAQGTRFSIRVVDPTVDAFANTVTIWQIKVGSQWINLTEVTSTPRPTSPTYEISDTDYFAAQGGSGSGQTVVIRGCATTTNCGADGGTTQITIPAR